MLLAGLNEAVISFALRIIDGNATPKRELPDREKLEFAGPGVVMSITKDRVVATISGGVTDHGDLTGLADNDHTQYCTGASGVDGATASMPSQTVLVRLSRVHHDNDITANQNNYSSGNSATADWFRFTATGTFRVFTGFAAPGADDTIWKVVSNIDSSTNLEFSHNSGSSSAGNRILCPSSLTYVLRPGNSMLMYYDRNASVLAWRIVEREWSQEIADAVGAAVITDHGALSGLADDDHTQYILVAGTRDFTGNQSMGGFALLNARTVEYLTDPPGAPVAERVRAYGFTNGAQSPGMLNVRTEDAEMVVDECVAYVRGTVTGGTTGAIDIDFTDINGRSLSDGVFKVVVNLISRNITASRSYPQVNLEQWIHYEMDVDGTNTYSQVMDQQATVTPTAAAAIAYWDGGNIDSSTIFISHTRVGGSTLQINWAANPGGTDDWRHAVLVRITGLS